MKLSSQFKFAAFLAGGALAGAGLGYLNQCTGGSCPLLCMWWRGALFGAITGLVVYLAVRPDRPGPTQGR